MLQELRRLYAERLARVAALLAQAHSEYRRVVERGPAYRAAQVWPDEQ